MSDPGVLPVETIGKSHTSTEQWQSFEGRMRRRRAERCVARADLALKAGLISDAQAATDEARALDPAAQAIADLDQRIAASRVSALARRRRMIRHLALATGCVVFAGVAWAGWKAVSSQASTPHHVKAAAHHDIVLTASAPRDPIGAIETPAPPLPALLSDPAPAAARETAAVAAAPAALPADALDSGSTTGDAPEPASEPPRTPARASVPGPGPSDNPAPVPGPLITAEAAAPASDFHVVRQVEPVVPTRTAPAEPATVPTAIASTSPAPPASDIGAGVARGRDAETSTAVDPKAGIRATLARFEAAYSRLDASAAHDVWPAVDERALAHAFDGLASQRVSLGTCDVTLNGASARATCSGRAAWTPKVGGGQRTESRQWTFDLKNADGTWRITRAGAR